MTSYALRAILVCCMCSVLFGCGGGTSRIGAVPTTGTTDRAGRAEFGVRGAPMVVNAPLPASAMRGTSAGRMPASDGRHTSQVAWNWNLIAANASQVALAPDGTIWALATNGPNGTDKYIWHYIGGGWRNVPGYGIQIAIAPDGSLWDLTASGAVWHLINNATWVPFGGAASSITVDRSGNPWVTASSDHTVWEYAGGWHQMTGFGVRLASNPDNSLYVLSAGGAIWDDAAFSGYLQCAGTGAVDIAAKPGGLGFYFLSGQSNSLYGLWDFTAASPGDCRSGSFIATGWLVSNVSFLGNTLAVISNGGNVYTTIANMPSCSVPTGQANGGGGYTPCDLQSAYSFPSLTAGVGHTIGIVDAYDDPNAESDLAVYRSNFGLPACTTANGCFRKVSQHGTTSYPAASSKWAGEISLDLDMVSATCPNCHIMLVEADDNLTSNLAASVDEAAALGATEISGSYGALETSGNTAFNSHYNHPGIPITISSGDGGYGASFPATSPYVVAVGGTNLLPSSSLRGWSETAWGFQANIGADPAFIGAGSGCSAYLTKPSWQLDSGCSSRMVADVSAVADLNTGVAVYNTFSGSGWQIWGGTSVAAPIIAGAFALGGGAAASSPGAYLYAHSSQLWNITSGTNGPCAGVPQYFCFAGVGYNGPTGLGTPNGLGAFGGASIASAGRSPLSAQDRQRLSQSYVANPILSPACPPPAPGYAQCHGILRIESGPPRGIPPGPRKPL